MALNQIIDEILSIAVGINGFLFWALVVFLVLIFLVMGISALRGSGFGTAIGGGVLLFFVVLTIGQGVIYFLNSVMSDSWGPEGPIDLAKFLIAAVISFFIGIS